MNQPAPITVQDNEGVQESENRRWSHEEIDRDNTFGVVSEKGLPRLCRWPPTLDHVFGHGRLGHFDPTFWSSPWIRGAPHKGLARLT